MVQLYLSTAKGNAGIRHFPFQGYLGLTPVRVEGIVRTRCDEDQKPVQASSLTVYVRAYESRQTRIGAPHSRIVAEYSQLIWRAPDGQNYASLSDSDAPFKITLPKRAPGFSTAHYQDYRTFWRVEAVLEHQPQPTVGSRIVKYFELPLIRYDLPPSLPTPSPSLQASHIASSSSSGPTLPHITKKPRAPVLHYNLSTPPYPIGPSDLLFMSLFIRPQDPSVSIRSASLLVERRIELAGTDYLQVPPLVLSPQIALSSSAPETDSSANNGYSALPVSYSTSTLHSTISTNTVTSRSPLLPLGPLEPQADLPMSPPPTARSSGSYHSHSSNSSHSPITSPISPSSPLSPPSDKVLVTSVAASSFPSFTLDPSTGVFNKTVSLQWPESRSHSRWSMGETMRGALGSVSFWVRVKVIVTSPTTGTETIDLAPRELSVVLTNDSERRQAVAHFAEVHARSAERRRATTAPGSSSGADPSSSSSAGGSSQHQTLSTHVGTYVPPKSADAAWAKALEMTVSPSPVSPVPRTSPASELRKVQEKPPRKKSRRPHTSAGPQDRGRDSMDVPALPMLPPHAKASVGLGVMDRGASGNGTGMVDATNLKTIARARGAAPGYPYPYSKPQAHPGTPFAFSPEVSSAGVTPPSPSPLSSSPRSSGSLSVTGKRERERGQAGVSPATATDAVRAWEEELARIERASKRGSQDMLSFFRRRDRTREREVKEVKMPR